MTTIQKNSRGEAVKTLQHFLHLNVDGIFGPLTEEAVKEFQKQNGLTADGIVGEKTWEKILDIPSTLASTTTNPRNIKEIIVHCSATPKGEDYTVDNIRAWHKERGFTDIGYHYVVYRDGTVHTGRNEAISGAHCTGHNTISIGVCYIGGCPERSVQNWSAQSEDTRTSAQKSALVTLLKKLKAKYPQAKIYGHRDFANKSCPSFDAKKEYAYL